MTRPGWTATALAVGLALLPMAAGAQAGDDAAARSENGCSYFLALYASKGEAAPTFQSKIPQWKADCEHHPDARRCPEVNDQIRQLRGVAPLTCVGARR